MPTGVAMRDAREQLFAAAERVLQREGPGALTSRAVTTEAGCAKGVLHRHFADFDGFLAELVLDRIQLIHNQSSELRVSAGTGTVADTLTDVLMDLFGSIARQILGLVTFRDGLRVRLREAGLVGVPVLTEASAMVAAYLSAERDLGRIAADTDVDMLAMTLIGTVHMLFADQDAVVDGSDALRTVVRTVIAGVQRNSGQTG